MIIEVMKQNTEAMIELANNYNELFKEKEKILAKIEEAKVVKDKETKKELGKNLVIIDSRLQIVKQYLMKLITNLQKLIEKEKNAL